MKAYQGPIQTKTQVSKLIFTNFLLEKYTNTSDGGFISQPSINTNSFDVKFLLVPLLTNTENYDSLHHILP